MTEWVQKNFGNCSLLIKDTFTPSEKESIPYIGLEHIEQNSLQLNGIGNSSDVISNKFRFIQGDILFGKLRPYFRKVVCPEFDGICSTDIFVVRAKPGTDQKFLYYWMASQEFIDLADLSSTGSRMPRADWDFLCNIEKEIPPLREQEKISKILTDLDKTIQNLQKQNEILEKIIQSIFKSWFVDFDGQTEFVDSELGEIPKGWKVKQFEKVIELLYGKSLTENKRIKGNIPVFGSSGIIGYHNESLVQGPGIIVGRKGNVGSVFWSHSDFYPIDTVYYVKSGLPLEFVFYLLKTLNFINSDSSVPGLSREQVYSLSILVPDNDVLKQFSNMMNVFYICKRLIGNKIEILTKIRDSLLPKLMSGEIKVSID